ncbi:MAG: hypothetical protein KAT33_02635 [Bacteroidales bacterium]|nr:hypothetical protein [Bacteroidales bacterium]
MKVTKIIFVFIIIIIFSCSNKRKIIDKHINNLYLQYPFFDKNNWELQSDYIFNYSIPGGIICLEKKDGDTIKYLTFQIIRDKNEMKYFVNNHRYEFSDSLYFHEIYIYGRDTLCYFVQNKDNMIDKYFIIGKYYYQYEIDKSDHSKLYSSSKGQSTYYLLNKDSLIKIRGNDLPELPELILKKPLDSLTFEGN